MVDTYNYNLELVDWPQFQHNPQHTGCYDCDRPKSILTNKATTQIYGTLILKVQKYSNGNWIDYKIVFQENGAILPGQPIKLDGNFNPQNVIVKEAGKYRVAAEFRTSRGSVEDSWEFEVV